MTLVLRDDFPFVRCKFDGKRLYGEKANYPYYYVVDLQGNNVANIKSEQLIECAGPYRFYIWFAHERDSDDEEEDQGGRDSIIVIHNDWRVLQVPVHWPISDFTCCEYYVAYRSRDSGAVFVIDLVRRRYEKVDLLSNFALLHKVCISKRFFVFVAERTDYRSSGIYSYDLQRQVLACLETNCDCTFCMYFVDSTHVVFNRDGEHASDGVFVADIENWQPRMLFPPGARVCAADFNFAVLCDAYRNNTCGIWHIQSKAFIASIDTCCIVNEPVLVDSKLMIYCCYAFIYDLRPNLELFVIVKNVLARSLPLYVLLYIGNWLQAIEWNGSIDAQTDYFVAEKLAALQGLCRIK